MNVEAQAAGAGLPTHEIVYRQMREMILHGELAPGQAVTIQGLVETLGVGMTPVREALRRLTTEGALDALGNRRIAVPVLDARALDELRFARLALEPELAKRAALRASPADVDRLRQTDARLDRAIQKGDVKLYLIENHKFHTQLNFVADAPILTSMVEGLWLRFGPSMRVICGQIGTRNLPDRHKDLIHAFEAKDPDAAMHAMRSDVEQGMDMVVQSLPV